MGGMTPEDIGALLDWGCQLGQQLAGINHKLGVIMSEDAAVQAVTADIQAQLTAVTNALSSIASTVAELVADVSSNPTSVSPATVSALQAASGSLDQLAAAAAQQATAEASEVPPPPPAT